MKNFYSKIVLIIAISVFVSFSLVLGQGSWREKIKARQSQREDMAAEMAVSTKEESIVVDDRKRTYIVHLPPQYKEGISLPLVFVLHGGGGNAKNAMNMAGMNSLADEEGFIVVYPTGSGRLKDKFLSWNDGLLKLYAAKQNIDDVKFFRRMIEKLKEKYNIDQNRIYSTGISNGGIMSYKLACELSDKIAAIAPVAASLDPKSKMPDEPVSVIIFSGTADEHIPYYGGYGEKSKAKIDHKPVSYAVDFWVKNNGCSPIPKREEFGSIIKETYTGGRENTEVILYTIKGGGHSWPGGKEGLKYGNADPPTQEIGATKLIWEFFKKHSKE